jgi:Flp pilus assembly pilin Flp
MRSPVRFFRRLALPCRTDVSGWLRNERGAAAIEFAIVAVPLLLFMMGIVGIGLYFFTGSALNHGVEAAARKIRTGEAQKDALTVGGFKDLVCEEAGSYINCNKLRVHIDHGDNWSEISPQPCVDENNNLIASTGQAEDEIVDYTGEASQVVLVTVCYQWDLAQAFSFLKLGTKSDGSGPVVLEASTAFRTEPYS